MLVAAKRANAHQNEYTHVVRRRLKGIESMGLSADLARLPLEDCDRLFLSLAWVRDVDASGIAVLVRLYSQMTRQGKTLMLTDVPRGVRAQLDRYGLTTVIPIHQRTPDTETAPVSSHNAAQPL